MKYIVETEDPFAEAPDNIELEAVRHEDELRSVLRNLLEDARYKGVGWQLKDVYYWAGEGRLVPMDVKQVEEHRDDGWLDTIYEVAPAVPGNDDVKPVRFTVSIDERMP